MIRPFLKWAGNILTVALLIIAGMSVYSILQSRMHPGQVPSILGYMPMSVLTGSMRPVLEPGDMIIVRKKDPGAIQTGDVITYRMDANTLVTHRVVEIVNKDGNLQLRTKGDANNTEDERLVASNQVIGSLFVRIPYGGYAAKFVRNPAGFFILILIPILLLIMGEVKKVTTALEDNQKKKQSS